MLCRILSLKKSKMCGLYAHEFEVSSGLVDILPRMHKKESDTSFLALC